MERPLTTATSYPGKDHLNKQPEETAEEMAIEVFHSLMQISSEPHVLNTFIQKMVRLTIENREQNITQLNERLEKLQSEIELAHKSLASTPKVHADTNKHVMVVDPNAEPSRQVQ